MSSNFCLKYVLYPYPGVKRWTERANIYEVANHILSCRVKSQNSRLLHPKPSVLVSSLHHRPLDAADVVGHLVDDGVLRPALHPGIRILSIPLLPQLESFDEAVLDLLHGSTKKMDLAINRMETLGGHILGIS